jgi:hypothetical protein
MAKYGWNMQRSLIVIVMLFYFIVNKDEFEMDVSLYSCHMMLVFFSLWELIKWSLSRYSSLAD